MKETDFRALVKEMREKQRRYFGTKSHIYLTEARKLEDLVDAALASDVQREMVVFVKYRTSDGINITGYHEETVQIRVEEFNDETVRKRLKYQPDSYYRGARIILDDMKVMYYL